jgi:hypothetical protein
MTKSSRLLIVDSVCEKRSTCPGPRSSVKNINSLSSELGYSIRTFWMRDPRLGRVSSDSEKVRWCLGWSKRMDLCSTGSVSEFIRRETRQTEKRSCWLGSADRIWMRSSSGRSSRCRRRSVTAMAGSLRGEDGDVGRWRCILWSGFRRLRDVLEIYFYAFATCFGCGETVDPDRFTCLRLTSSCLLAAVVGLRWKRGAQFIIHSFAQAACEVCMGKVLPWKRERLEFFSQSEKSFSPQPTPATTTHS